MTTSLLTFSSLYPDTLRPGYGLFVESRLRNLLAGRDYQSRVVSPVPWFPWRSPRFGKYAIQAQIPGFEKRYSIPVWHPRYKLIPKIGMSLTPRSMWRGVMKSRDQWLSDAYSPQVIDAHYFFPDGVAAAHLAESLDVPLMITARGSDINLISQYDKPLKMMREAAAQSQAIVAVSAALADKMKELGFDEQKIHVLRNGVDLNVFRPLDRLDLRAKYGVSERVLLSVGNLVALKGHKYIIDALRSLDNTILLIAGAGPGLAELRQQAQKLGVADRVRFLGQVTQTDLRKLYNIADALVLASSREGLANVLLEAIACGTPVAATAVGGNPEVVCDSRAGVLMEERSAHGVVDAIKRLESLDHDRQSTRDFAQRFGWQDTCHKLDQLIQRIL